MSEIKQVIGGWSSPSRLLFLTLAHDARMSVAQADQEGFLVTELFGNQTCLGRSDFRAKLQNCSVYGVVAKTWSFGYADDDNDDSSDWLHLVDDDCLTYDGDDPGLQFFGNCVNDVDQAWSLVGDMLYNKGNDVCAWAFSSGEVRGYDCNYTGCDTSTECTRRWVFNTSAPQSHGVLKSNLFSQDMCMGSSNSLAHLQDCSSIRSVDKNFMFGGKNNSVSWLHLLDDDCLTYDGDGPNLKFFGNCADATDQAWSYADNRLYNEGNNVCAWAFLDGSVQGLPCDYTGCNVFTNCSNAWTFEPGTSHRPTWIWPLVGAVVFVVIAILAGAAYIQRNRQRRAGDQCRKAPLTVAAEEEGAIGEFR